MANNGTRHNERERERGRRINLDGFSVVPFTLTFILHSFISLLWWDRTPKSCVNANMAIVFVMRIGQITWMIWVLPTVPMPRMPSGIE